MASSGVAGASPAKAPFNALEFQRQHGYLPIHGVAALERAKARSAAEVAALHPQRSAQSPAVPSIGASWSGSAGGNPPDANGTVGPKSYIEITNNQISIYKRNGSLIMSVSLFTLVGHSVIGDPTVIWDPDTQRFYYSLIGPTVNTINWGFSKDNNPLTIPGGFCGYQSDFGFPSGQLLDYPKLGQTKGFLMVGINLYPPGQQAATEGDVLWMNKPQGSAPIATCPAASKFNTGVFHDLRNQDGSQGFTPVPAIQTDPSPNGYVTTMSDIECPPICGKGALLTTYTLKPSASDPKVPTLSKPVSVTVGKFKPPADAPQAGTDRLLDTLDGRLTHSVSGIDPVLGKTTVWISHCVLGGAGAEVRWYEIKPGKSASIVQSGTVSDSNLYVYDGAISNDRTVNAAGKTSHGGAMVLGFNTSSASAFVAVQMVSKVGAHPQSTFVMVHQSTAPYAPAGCGSLGCRWGDYSGATPDPAASMAAKNGEVWLTSEWTSGDSNRPTWNWEALP